MWFISSAVGLPCRGQILSGLGCQLSIIQSGTLMTGVPIEQVYKYSQSNVPTTVIVNMTIPNLVGVTASPAGSYVIDSFKVALRHQNSHAYCNAAFVLGVTISGSTVNVTSARMSFGGVGAAVFRATNTEAMITGQARVGCRVVVTRCWQCLLS